MLVGVKFGLLEPSVGAVTLRPTYDMIEKWLTDNKMEWSAEVNLNGLSTNKIIKHFHKILSA